MNVSASAPGRICLFGEHQDYFGLPVLAAAIDVRCHIESSSRSDCQVHLELTDLGTGLTFDLDDLGEPPPRGYWLSALKVAHAEGWLPQDGWNATVTSDIPQQAGASSSTALLVAWCALIAERAGKVVDSVWVARAAHRAEVEYFNEPGGQMDQYACALGGVHRFSFQPEFKAETWPIPSGEWLLLDSREPKNTLGILHRAKTERLELLQAWSDDWDLLSSESPPDFPPSFSAKQRALMQGTLDLRSVSEQGPHAIREFPSDSANWAVLLTEHHRLLRDILGVSTERIENLLLAAQSSGAWGGKINGSGGGGTCFVVGPPEATPKIQEHATSMGAVAIPIQLGAPGVRVFQQD